MLFQALPYVLTLIAVAGVIGRSTRPPRSAARTRSSSGVDAGAERVRERPRVAAVVVGLLSTATMPVAIVATRYSESYELLHAGFAIPVGVVLGIIALRLAQGAMRHDDVRLGRAGGRGAARLGRALGVLGHRARRHVPRRARRSTGC